MESDKGEEELDVLDSNFMKESCETVAASMERSTIDQIISCNPMESGIGEEGSTMDFFLREGSTEIDPLLDGGRQSMVSSDTPPPPMYTVIPINSGNVDYNDSKEFTMERVFQAASQGDKSQLHGLLEFLQDKGLKLSSEEFIDREDGKTALMAALLLMKDGKNDTIEEFLDIAEKTGDLEELINASFINDDYNGQTALHIAIVRRSFDHVKLLVQKGADIQAKANGEFFRLNEETGFYFGELPLSLAACTNQPDIVSFLIENGTRCDDKDSQGNTVLHALVVVADNEKENTDMFASMYDKILTEHNKLEETREVRLEAMENKQGFTPLKLAAKLGKIGLLKHMLHREFKDENMKHLTRKLKGWHYGPVQSSLYDMTSIDTNERNSVLKIVVYGSDIPKRAAMLQIEPLRSILQDKWKRFASKLFLMNFLVYLVYLTIFSIVAFYSKDGQPPFPIEYPVDYLRTVGEIISVLGAVWILYKAIRILKRNRPNFKALYTDGFYDILFLLQSSLLLIATVLYLCGLREYLGLLVLSLALAWINVLYYTRGSKQLGIYSIMIQRMILGDVLNFLCVYIVLLGGFSLAIVSLIKDEQLDYYDIRFTIMEMFKFTIGMGNLEFTRNVHFKEVFYILLIFYIVLTYILLLNMIIALMGNTVSRISEKSKNLWNLQKAFMILDMERSLPRCLKSKLRSGVSGLVCLEQYENRRFIRVAEKNWKQFRSDLVVFEEINQWSHMMGPQTRNKNPGNTWSPNSLFERIRARYRH